MTYAHLQLVTPTTAKRTVTPRRLPNHELRPREHLTEREVEKLIEAAKKNRHGRLCSGQPRYRHTNTPKLPRASQHPINGPLHGIGARSFQEHLEVAPGDEERFGRAAERTDATNEDSLDY